MTYADDSPVARAAREQGAKWEVGQRVYLRDVNENRRRDPSFIPPVVTIAKVGRTLVHIEQYGRLYAYSKETGRRHDKYGHGWLQTFEEYADESARVGAYARLREHGLEFRLGRREWLTAAQASAVADLLDTFGEA